MDFTEDHTVRESTQYHHRYSRILSIFCLSWQYRFHLPDTVVSALLMFISAFLTVLNVMVKSDLISAVIRILPTTVNKCRSLLGVKENFQTYVCCKKCNTLYQLDKCLDKINGKLVSKRCIHIDFPNHPMPSFRRKKCDALLLKDVRIGSKHFHYPFRNFCYKSLTQSLTLLLSRENFIAKCEHWRHLQYTPHLLKAHMERFSNC